MTLMGWEGDWRLSVFLAAQLAIAREEKAIVPVVRKA